MNIEKQTNGMVTEAWSVPEIMARANVGRDAVSLALSMYLYRDDDEAVSDGLRIMHEKGLKAEVLRALEGMRNMREEAEGPRSGN